MLSRYVSRSLHGRQYASVVPSLYRGFASSSARMRECYCYCLLSFADETNPPFLAMRLDTRWRMRG